MNDGLSPEIDALRAQVNQLQAALAAVTAQLETLTATSAATTTQVPHQPTSEPTIDLRDPARGLSRRRLLTRVPAAVAAGVGVTALAGVLEAAPAAATTGVPMIVGGENDGGGATTALRSPGQPIVLQIGDEPVWTTLGASKVALRDVTGPDEPMVDVQWEDLGIQGMGSVRINGGLDQPFLRVEGINWRHVGSGGSPAIHASSVASAAVIATADPGDAPVEGFQTPGTGVDASATSTGTGVRARSEAGSALLASTSSTSSTTDAVAVTNAGKGRAFMATSTNPANDVGAVTGVNRGTGAGVWGTQANPDATGAAVVGWASTKGRGGRFRGGAAAVTLVPSQTAWHPYSGQAGDLVVDKANRLWFCKGGTNWKQLA